MTIDKTPYLQQFQKFYFEKYGKPISLEEVEVHFDQLVTLVEAVYKPIPEDKLEYKTSISLP